MSAAGKKLAQDLVNDLPPPDRLKRRPPGDEGEGADEMSDEEGGEGGAAMGSALASALKGGDGQAVYDAFKDLMDACR